MRRRVLAIAGMVALASGLAACHAAPPGPAPLDTRNELCRFCRMPVSDTRFAAQLVAPGEEPLFFDDIGCLAAHLARTRLPGGAVAYVSDHRTRAWVAASVAVFTRVDGLETPMNSHLMAHSDAASRDTDPAASGGRPLSLAGLVAAVPKGEVGR